MLAFAVEAAQGFRRSSVRLEGMRCHRRELGRVPGLRAAHGFADEGFGPVADAFKDNFDRGTETGAVGFPSPRGSWRSPDTLRSNKDCSASTTR